MKTLRATERCPIHGRKDCCGRYRQPLRERHGAWIRGRDGVLRSSDGRQKKTPAQKRRRKDDLLRAGTPCAACHEQFTDYRDAELAHIRGKGLGGAFRDDSDKNTTLLHYAANRDQGSMELETYLATKWKSEICKG